MLVEKAIADAFGAGYEFKKRPIALDRYYGRGKDKTVGRYTDDTQMEIAIAELMLSGKDPSLWTHLDVATAFLIAFKRDPRGGYARGFYQLLMQVESPVELLSKLRPHSTRNGAAMRCSCIGLLPDAQQVVDLAMMQGAVTHATQDGLAAAAAAALMVHAFRHAHIERKHLGSYLWDRVPLPLAKGRWHHTHQGPVPISAVETVRAAITALRSSDTMSGVLQACVAFSGDTDTVAAIAIPAASVCLEIDNDLLYGPLQNKLEDGEYGLEYLQDLDEKLISRFGDAVPDFYWEEHHKDCGTAYRGCSPECPKDIYERTGIWTVEEPERMTVIKDRNSDGDPPDIDWGDPAVRRLALVTVEGAGGRIPLGPGRPEGPDGRVPLGEDREALVEQLTFDAAGGDEDDVGLAVAPEPGREQLLPDGDPGRL